MEIIKRLLKEKHHLQHNLLILKILLKCRPQDNQLKRLAYTEIKLGEVQKMITDYQQKVDLELNNNILYNQIINDYETIKSLIADLKGEIYSCFKAAILVILDNKSNELLQQFADKLSELMVEYQSVDNASTNIYYRSGEFLSNVSTEIIKYIKKYSNEKTIRVVPYQYFVEHEVIISFNIRQWMEFYNNTRFTIKYLQCNDHDDYQKIKDLFNKLEYYYFLIIACLGDE